MLTIEIEDGCEAPCKPSFFKYWKYPFHNSLCFAVKFVFNYVISIYFLYEFYDYSSQKYVYFTVTYYIPITLNTSS